MTARTQVNTPNPEVNTFLYNTKDIRVVTIEGRPWFVAADVCKVLNIQIQEGGEPNVTVALRKLEPVDVSLCKIQGNRGARQVKVVTEPGLYKLVMKSRKPEAKEFQNWVTQTVLPAIRKDGADSSPS